jgi:UDP-glucose 4-epimerase
MRYKSKRRTIVTGGVGFIGSHLVESLLKDGHRVTVLDNFSTGRPQNLKHIKNRNDLMVIKVDIADFAKIKKYFKGVDWVFHLAGLADIVPSIKNPLEYYHSNVDGTASVLEASRLAGVNRFIYAASSSCYGIPDEYPTPETAQIRLCYPYALTKYIGELNALYWGRIYKLPVVSLRLFNVYGPRSRTSGVYGAVFGVFLAQKLAGRPYTVVGDGRQCRDFIFVTDVVRAFITTAESNIQDEVLNVGSGNSYSINRLVELLGGAVVHIPKRPGEPDKTQADITKIKKLLGWKTEVLFEDGIKILLENIDYWREAPVWIPEKIEEATKECFKYLS